MRKILPNIMRALKRISAAVSKIDIRDCLVFGGIGLVAVGFWFIHKSLAFISAGLGVFLIGTGIVKVK